MRVSSRFSLSAVAIFCLAALTTSTSLAGVQKRTHASSQVRTYSTPGTAPLATALDDPWLFNSEHPNAFAMTKSAGATFVRLPANWSSIAPSTRPDGFVATDPTSPGYTWGGLDASVAAAENAGLTPILDLQSVPQWAYTKKPQGVNAGTPKIAALADFAQALAAHFSSSLNTVRYFEVWNEPNVSLYLSPVNANTYRSMVNAVANAVHSADSTDIVIAGNLDPFGHPKSKKQKWNSVHPLAFMRSVLCLSKGAHPHRTCSAAVHFDIWSHHPYTFNGPFGHATNPDDVSLGDLPKMRALLQAGVRLHRVVSTHPVKFWATEFSWDTNPPRRHAAPTALAARWTAEAFHQMWRSGISLVTWFGLQDRGGSSQYQSGLFRHSSSLDDAKPKAVLTAFRFPFVAYLGHGSVSVWGRDVTSDQRVVTIQRRHGKSGPWTTVAKVRSNSSGIFKANLKLSATKKDWVRATASGSGSSLGFSLTRPSPKLRYGPWGN